MEINSSMSALEVQRGNNASGVTVRLDAIDFDNEPICNRLLGFIDYYEIIFKEKDLIKKESEFRNNKLGMILDLISIIAIPEDIMNGLRSTIIASWRLKVPGSTREKRSAEIRMVLNCIERLRTAIRWAESHHGLEAMQQLDVAVLHSLAMRDLDLESEYVGKVRDLLNQALEHLEIVVVYQFN